MSKREPPSNKSNIRYWGRRGGGHNFYDVQIANNGNATMHMKMLSDLSQHKSKTRELPQQNRLFPASAVLLQFSQPNTTD